MLDFFVIAKNLKSNLIYLKSKKFKKYLTIEFFIK